jgi:hypothetical protein
VTLSSKVKLPKEFRGQASDSAKAAECSPVPKLTETHKLVCGERYTDGFRAMTLFLICVAVPAAILGTGALYQVIGKALDRRRFPAQGRYVLVNGRRIHLIEEGAGPTVVLEAGIASTSLAWVGIRRLLKDEARVIVYDRAGLGWSDRPKSARTLDNIVAELHAVLEHSGAPKP